MTFAFSTFPTYVALILTLQSLVLCMRVSIPLLRAHVWREATLAGLGFLFLTLCSGFDLWTHSIGRILGRELFLASGFVFLVLVFQGVSPGPTDSVNMRRLLLKILIFGLLFAYFVAQPGREFSFILSGLFLWILMGLLLFSKRKEVRLPLRSYLAACLFMLLGSLRLFWNVPWVVTLMGWFGAQYFFFLMLNYFLCRSVVLSRLE